MRDKILAFVEDNPRCTSEQISHAIDMPACRVTVEMAALKRRGHVVSEKMTGIRQHYYSLPDAHAGLDGTPVRVVVKEWPRAAHAPKTWIAALEWEPA